MSIKIIINNKIQLLTRTKSTASHTEYEDFATLIKYYKENYFLIQWN